jgi:hypothetical protein
VRAISASIFCSIRQFAAAAAPGHQGDANGAGQQYAPRHHPGNGEEHADHRTKHDQRYHARLGQLEVMAQPVGAGLQFKGGGFHVQPMSGCA